MITNSVPRLVSELGPSSEIMSEDRGETISRIRSTVSSGMTIRSRAALALNKSISSACPSGPLCVGPYVSAVPIFELPTNETTLHCIPLLSARSTAVKTCVPIGVSESRIVTGMSRMG